jgi:hypothetical protein
LDVHVAANLQDAQGFCLGIYACDVPQLMLFIFTQYRPATTGNDGDSGCTQAEEQPPL